MVVESNGLDTVARAPQPSTHVSEVNPTGMYGQVELITLDVAQAYLALMPKDQQRWLRAERVNNYAAARIADHWPLHHQGIAFDTEGRLRDGQHRLHMIIRTGLPTPLFVVRNVHPDAFLHVDEQLPRSIRDAIKMAGQGSFTSALLSVARVLYDYPGDEGHHRGFSKELVIERVRLWSEELDFTHEHLRGRSGLSRGVRAVVCRAKAILGASYETRLEEWCQILSDGHPVSANATDDSAAIAFRNVLLQKPSRDNGLRPPRPGILEGEKYRKGQAALRAFLSRQPLKKVYAKTEDIFPIPANRLESPPSPESSAAKE
jgi:hypothetical protein